MKILDYTLDKTKEEYIKFFLEDRSLELRIPHDVAVATDNLFRWSVVRGDKRPSLEPLIQAFALNIYDPRFDIARRISVVDNPDRAVIEALIEKDGESASGYACYSEVFSMEDRISRAREEGWPDHFFSNMNKDKYDRAHVLTILHEAPLTELYFYLGFANGHQDDLEIQELLFEKFLKFPKYAKELAVYAVQWSPRNYDAIYELTKTNRPLLTAFSSNPWLPLGLAREILAEHKSFSLKENMFHHTTSRELWEELQLMSPKLKALAKEKPRFRSLDVSNG